MDGVLYHYCSTQTGFSILQNRTFRLSPLSSANDSLEGRVLGAAFLQLLRKSSLNAHVSDVASAIVEGYASSTEGFAFCLSEDGDLLSQWRAYARDGTGVSIGFDPDVLRADFGKVNFGSQFYELAKVGYGQDSLIDILSPFAEELSSKMSKYGEFVRFREGVSRSEIFENLSDREKSKSAALFTIYGDSAQAYFSEMLEILRPLHFRIYLTKESSFQEERE